jgi:hypothetical protein
MKSRSFKHLEPEAPRHQWVTERCFLEFDSRRLHQPSLMIAGEGWCPAVATRGKDTNRSLAKADHSLTGERASSGRAKPRS